MNKKLIVGLISISVIIVAIIGGFKHFQMELIDKKVSLELGEQISLNVSDYVTGNIKGSTLDLSNIDTRSTGIYNAYVTNKTSKLEFSVEVKDTVPPTADKINDLSFLSNELVYAESLVNNIKDYSLVTVTFSDNKKVHTYSKGGNVTEVVILTDDAGNKTNVNVTFKVISDTIKPEIKGVKDIKAYVSEKVDYLKGISATDNRDGIITEIIVDSSQVKVDKPGEYTVGYSVSDKAGNIATTEASVIILEDKAPVIKGLSDKVVFIDEDVNYLNGVAAIDDRDGDITSKLKVDKSKVNLKAVGSYKVFYTVVDSSGNETKETITVTVKAKKSTKSNNSQPSSSKTDKSKSKSEEKKKSTKGDSSGGFQFHEVQPSGEMPDGDVPAGGKQDVGTWG